MKTIFTYVSCFAIILLSSYKVSAQWTFIGNPDYPNANVLESAQFFSSDTGLVSSSIGLLYTTDSGSTWSKIDVIGIRDISFSNSQIGYAAGIAGNSLKKTTDGGQTWTALTPVNSNALWGVSVIDANTAYVCGTAGVVWVTTNGGTSFNDVSTSSDDLITDIFFTSASQGCVLDQLGYIYETTDGGQSWNTVYSNSDIYFTHLYFASANVGFAVGSSGFIVKTSDGGDTWTPLTSNSTERLADVQFCDTSNGMVVGDHGTVLRTTDGGATWFNVNIPATTNLDCCWMLSPNNAIVTGDSGTVYKNTNLTASINQVAKQPFNVKTFPNPFSNSITFSFTELTNAPDNIKVYNVLGDELFNGPVSGNSLTLNGDMLSPGEYYYGLNKKGIYINSGKIVKD